MIDENSIIINGKALSKEQIEVIRSALFHFENIGEGYSDEENPDIKIIESIENLFN